MAQKKIPHCSKLEQWNCTTCFLWKQLNIPHCASRRGLKQFTEISTTPVGIVSSCVTVYNISFPKKTGTFHTSEAYPHGGRIMMIHDEVKIKVCRPGDGLFEVSGEHLQVITTLTHYAKVTMFINRSRRMLRKWDICLCLTSRFSSFFAHMNMNNQVPPDI